MTHNETSPESLPETLIQTLTQLTAHLETENQLLKKRDAAALEPLAAEKARLTDAYLETMATVRRNPALLKEAPEDVKARLREAGESFNAVFEEHRRRVTILKEVSEGLINAITSQLDSKNRLSGMYGEAALPTRSAPNRPTSIAVDKQA